MVTAKTTREICWLMLHGIPAQVGMCLPNLSVVLLFVDACSKSTSKEQLSDKFRQEHSCRQELYM